MILIKIQFFSYFWIFRRKILLENIFHKFFKNNILI